MSSKGSRQGLLYSGLFHYHVRGAEAGLGRELDVSLTLFLGKSHLAPVHATLRVESLSNSARVLQTEKTTDSPVLFR